MGQDTTIEAGLQLVWTGKGSAVFFPRGTATRAAGVSSARPTTHGACSDDEILLKVFGTGWWRAYDQRIWDQSCTKVSEGGSTVLDLESEACQLLCDRPGGSPSEKLAITPFGSSTINWCRSMLPWAMNAEYCMWWAQRLWWWGRYCDSPWLIFMGLLCSRAALAEVCRMAGVVLHELCHKQQNSAFNAHCKALSKNECSAFWWEREFLNRMMARLGLPHPKSKVGIEQFSALQLMGGPLFHYDGVPKEDGCADFVLKTTHCNIAARTHFARLRTIVPGKCTTQKQDLVRLVELNQGSNLCF